MPASRRWLLGIVCAGGIALALAAYGRQWRYAQLPPVFPCESLAYPVEIEGYAAGDCAQLRFLAESWPPGARVTVIDATGRRLPVDLDLREGPTALVLTGFGGLVFLAAAAVFFVPRADQRGVADFFWITFLYGLAIMVGGVYFPREDGIWIAALGMVQIICLAALPAVFLRLALTFPRPSARFGSRAAMAPVWVAATGVAAWQSCVLLRYAADPTLAKAGALDESHVAGDLFLVALTAVGVVAFGWRARRLEMTRERNQVRWLLWGFAIGAGPYVFLRTLPGLAGLPPLMPPHVDRVIELAIPVAFIGAVVWDRFLDIDVIIRRSLLYGLLAGALLAVYLVAGVVFGRWLGEVRGADPWLLPVVLGLGAGIAFLPLRRALGGLIDRTFFKLAHGHDRMLEILDRELGSLADRGSLAEVLLRRVEDALDPRRLAVALDRSGGGLIAGDGDLEPLSRHLVDGLPAHAELRAAARATSLPETEDAAFPGGLLEAGLVLMQPLSGRGRPLGCLYVGRRATGRRWVEQDLRFLQACGRLAGRHLERIVLQQKVASETLARERLVELDRLKTEFLAQVAHDLRTPVAGISWSARNLLDGLAGEPTPPQAEYLRAIAGSGDHLNRLVDNLLEISRLDRAELTLEREPFPADAVWAEAMRMLAPHAQAKNVVLALHRNGAAPPVRGDRSRMMEVAVNILDNAVKYTVAGTSVDVTVAAAAGGEVTIRVRDRGPGLGGQSPSALFARFAQGEPSPHSTRKGFGLGLHIAATYMERMGGRLEAGDHPQGGAVFTCRLPAAEARANATAKGDVR